MICNRTSSNQAALLSWEKGQEWKAKHMRKYLVYILMWFTKLSKSNSVPRHHISFLFLCSAFINIFDIAYVYELDKPTYFALVLLLSTIFSSYTSLLLLVKCLTFSNLIVRKTSVWEPMKRSFSGDILDGKKGTTTTLLSGN